MIEADEMVIGTSNPYEDRRDPAAASKALKAEVMTEILKALRERELTTVEAAELAGVGRSQISRIKNGRIAQISLDKLVNVLDALTRDQRVILNIGYEPAVDNKRTSGALIG